GESAHAQETTVRASVDRVRIRTGDRITLTIDIEGGSSDQATAPDLSRIVDFDVVGGPSVSTRFQWVNGRSTSAKRFRYSLRPRKVGRLRIPPIGLLIAGRTYSTRALAVEVIRAGGRPGSGYGRGPGNQLPVPGRPGPDDPSRTNDDVRVQAEVDLSEVFVGQQVTMAFLLDTQPDLLGVALQASPAFPGFWAEEVKLPDNFDARRVQVAGLPYTRYTLMKRALFPTRTGELTIPAVTYQVQVRRRPTDPIQSFFFSPIDTLMRSTQPVTIRVLPLPDEEQPPGFAGAVGDFALSVTADRTESLVNDAIGLKVRVAGEGNLSAVSAPPLPDLADFKQYPPRVASQSSVRRDRLRGEKVWDYVLIPMAPGEQTIAPVRFSFFDPSENKYRTVWSAPITIQVARGEGQEGSPYGTVAQSDVRRLRHDINYIKLASDGLRDQSRPFYGAAWFTLLLLIPVAADVGIFAFALRRDHWRANARFRKQRRARRTARRRLKEASRRMIPTMSRAFYASLAQALTEYVADKFNTPAAGLTHQLIEELFSSRGVPEHLRRSFHRTLESCDFARFAPGAADAQQMTRVLKGAEETLAALDRSLSA
ncbi:MAG: BatD family protein, partial [Acidobacteriota bacterium]